MLRPRTIRQEEAIPVDKKTMERLRKALLERQAELEQEVGDLAVEISALGTDQGDENGGLGHSVAEDGTSLSESERLSTFSNDMQGMLAQIQQALERMDEGTYGTCLKCGKQINEERLEAFPYVPYCIVCQTSEERLQSIRSGH